MAQTADDVVVIHKGRSIVQSPLAELMARSGGGVRVAGPDVGRLAELLRADGASVADDGDGAHGARSHAARTSAGSIAANAVVISELAPVSSSLEEIYFELTGSEEGAGPT